MIIWITGNSGAGKTTLAKSMLRKNVIHLDGDEMRKTISTDCGFSGVERSNHCLRVARLAALMESQGFDVVVSVIAPYVSLRLLIDAACRPIWIYLPGGETGEDYPYEPPLEDALELREWKAL